MFFQETSCHATCRFLWTSKINCTDVWNTFSIKYIDLFPLNVQFNSNVIFASYPFVSASIFAHTFNLFFLCHSHSKVYHIIPYLPASLVAALTFQPLPLALFESFKGQQILTPYPFLPKPRNQ